MPYDVCVDETLLLSFAEIERTHWWFVVRRRIVEDAIDSLRLPETSGMLEVGCGTGGMLDSLTATFPSANVRGVEPSSAAADVAVSRGCHVHLGTFDTLPAENESIDLLIALDVLEHCEDDVAAAREAARVLASHGRFVLTVPALQSLWSPHDEDNHHYRRYSAATLRNALEAAGLEVERLTYFNSLLLPVAYVTRWIGRATGSNKTAGVSLPPKLVNHILKSVFALEVAALRHVDLPIGMSLLAVVRAKEVGK